MEGCGMQMKDCIHTNHSTAPSSANHWPLAEFLRSFIPSHLELG
jgi:hypothetical protein